ncbi:hypothetical protein N8996_07530 [Candidatus Poseidonia alphae]|nr:hypothetical protein [Candidatus Poseidonia alphae]
MFGVVKGLILCNNGADDEINSRIAKRNIPSASLQPQFDIRPVATKYGCMEVLDQYKKPTVALNNYKTYSTESVFNPGNAQAPWSGFSSNVNVESTLRNQFFAIQSCEQSTYVPSSNSDLYNTKIDYIPVKQTHPLLFEKQEFSQFNPNTFNCKQSIFNNSTVQCVKDGPMCEAPTKL